MASTWIMSHGTAAPAPGRAAGGQTIIMVTHAPEVAAAAGRIVRMRDGRAEGRP